MKLRSAILFATGLLLTGLAMLLSTADYAAAQQPSVNGLWEKIDDQTGKPVSWFLFVEQDGLYEGVIAKLFLRPNDAPNQTCANCRDDRKDESLLGLPLIRHMKRNGLAYRDGDILDPRSGDVYDAMMTVSPDGQQLTVRGYLGISIFGRDESWHRLPDDALKQLDPVVVARYLPGQMTHTVAAKRHAAWTAKSGSAAH